MSPPAHIFLTNASSPPLPRGLEACRLVLVISVTVQQQLLCHHPVNDNQGCLREAASKP